MTAVMPSSSKSASKRKHVTTACSSCRRSKVKCDGVVPSCSPCVSKNIECRYQKGDDRRKLSLRIAVEMLCRRVEQLSRHIEEQGLQIPSMPSDEEAALQRMLTVVGISPKKWTSGQFGDSPPCMSPSDSNAAVALTGLDAAIETQDIASMRFDLGNGAGGRASETQANLDLTEGSTLMTEPLSEGWDSVHPQQRNYGAPILLPLPDLAQNEDQNVSSVSDPFLRTLTTSVKSLEDEESDNESVEDLVQILSDRMGSLQIGAEGQMRYYGPTSDFSLLDMPSANPLHIHRSVRNDGQDYLDRFEVGAPIPAELEDHLVNLYFAWQDASFHVVEREMYEKGKLTWHQNMQDTAYYSEALRNAICSIGAAFETKYHPKFVTFPKSLADFFSDRTKMLMDIEMDAPCLATVQAMVVTSCHDMGCTRDARAWLYSGMASRLAFDLALHKDMAPYVAKGIITQSEANLRRTVFWGAYVVDQTWAFHLGRYLKTNMEDVTCARPGDPLETINGTPWTPYTSPKTAQMQLHTKGYIEEVSRCRVLPCEIMAPLGYNLYGNTTIVPATLQQLNADTVNALMNWKEGLPVELQIDVRNKCISHLPHVLLMHMHYYQSMIHAHRPWMSKTRIQPNPPQGPGSSHARGTCVDAAIAIARLLEAYETLILIFADVSHYRRLQGLDIAPYLSICFLALEQSGQSWENAKRARDLLIRLKRQWELEARSRRHKRKNSSLSNTSSYSPTMQRSTMMTSEASQFRSTPAWSMHQQSQRPTVNLELQEQRPEQGNEQGIYPEFDLDFDWIADARELGVTGIWSAVPSFASLPSDLAGIMDDSCIS